MQGACRQYYLTTGIYILQCFEKRAVLEVSASSKLHRSICTYHYSDRPQAGIVATGFLPYDLSRELVDSDEEIWSIGYWLKVRQPCVRTRHVDRIHVKGKKVGACGCAIIRIERGRHAEVVQPFEENL